MRLERGPILPTALECNMDELLVQYRVHRPRVDETRLVDHESLQVCQRQLQAATDLQLVNVFRIDIKGRLINVRHLTLLTPEDAQRGIGLIPQDDQVSRPPDAEADGEYRDDQGQASACLF